MVVHCLMVVNSVSVICRSPALVPGLIAVRCEIRIRPQNLTPKTAKETAMSAPEVNEVTKVTEVTEVTEVTDVTELNDEVNEVNEVNEVYKVNKVNKVNKVIEEVNKVNTSLDAALNGLHISKVNDVNKCQVVKEKNEQMIEEIKDDEKEEWSVYDLLFVYNPIGIKKDVATLADEWKEAPGMVKLRPVDGAVQKLLDHASSGQMLQVATTAVTLFQNLPRRKNGLCVGQTDTQDGSVAIMEVCIDDIVLISQT